MTTLRRIVELPEGSRQVLTTYTLESGSFFVAARPDVHGEWSPPLPFFRVDDDPQVAGRMGGGQRGVYAGPNAVDEAEVRIVANVIGYTLHGSPGADMVTIDDDAEVARIDAAAREALRLLDVFRNARAAAPVDTDRATLVATVDSVPNVPQRDALDGP